MRSVCYNKHGYDTLNVKYKFSQSHWKFNRYWAASENVYAPRDIARVDVYILYIHAYSLREQSLSSTCRLRNATEPYTHYPFHPICSLDILIFSFLPLWACLESYSTAVRKIKVWQKLPHQLEHLVFFHLFIHIYIKNYIVFHAYKILLGDN